MANNPVGTARAEAELVIRARQIGKESIQATTDALGKLNQKLTEHAAAARNGELSVKELETTLKAFEDVGQKLLSTQVGVIEQYGVYARQLQEAGDRADELRAKQAAMVAAQAAAGTQTQRDVKNLNDLQKSINRADEQVVKATGNLARQADIIQRLGGDINNLDVAQGRIAENVRNVGAALTHGDQILERYTDDLKVFRTEAERVAQIDAFGKLVQGEADLERTRQRMADVIAAFQEADAVAAHLDTNMKAAEKNIRQQAEFEYEQAYLAAEQQKRRADDLKGFRQQGADALAAAGDLNQLVQAQKAATASTASFGAALQGILDPAAAARQTLAGLEAEIARIGTGIGTAGRSIAEYNADLSDLGKIQSAISAQGKLIDQFNTQKEVVDRLSASYQTNLQAVRDRSNAILAAKEPEEAEIEALKREQGALGAVAAELDREREKLANHAATLGRAGINANDIPGEQQRLQTASIAVGTHRQAIEGQQGLTEFHQTGADAAAAAHQVDQLAAAQAAAAGSAAALAASATNLSGAIRSILDPGAAARSTLEGLEGEIGRVTAEIGDAKRPIADYQDQLRDLDKLKAGITGHVKIIDQFKEQRDSVDALEKSFKANLTAVRNRAAAIQAAGKADAAEVAALKQEEQELGRVAAQLQKEREELIKLDAALQKAGIDTNHLSDAENRLSNAAQKVAGQSSKLDANKGGGNAGFFGKLLGLKPYQVTNLGYQVNDVLTQAASGTPPIQILAQQTGQIVQIPGVLAAMVRFAPQLVVIGAAVTTLVATLTRIVRYRDDLIDFTRQLELTGAGAIYNATALAQMAEKMRDLGYAAKDARVAMEGFLKAGVNPDRILQFAEASLQLSRQMKVDLPTATKAITEGFSGGYEAIKKLDDEYDLFTVQERKAIRDMFDAGKGADGLRLAFDLAFDHLAKGSDGARTEFETLIHDLGNLWRGLIDFLAHNQLTEILGHEFDRIAGQARALLERLDAARDKPVKPPPQVKFDAQGNPVMSDGSPVTADTRTRIKDADDYNVKLKQTLNLAHEIDDAEQIKQARLDAYKDSFEKFGIEKEAQERGDLKAADKEREINERRAAENQQLVAQLKSSLIAAGQADDANLAARLAGNAAARAEQEKQIQDLEKKRKGILGVPGASTTIDVPGLGNFDPAKMRAAFDNQKALADQASTLAFYTQQVNDYQKQYNDLLQTANDKYAAHSITAVQASEDIKTAQAQVLPLMEKSIDRAQKFAAALMKADPSPKTRAFFEMISNLKDQFIAKAQTDQLKPLIDDVTKAQSALTERLASIKADREENLLPPDQALGEIDKAQADLGPRIADAAKAVLNKVTELLAQHATPELEALAKRYGNISAQATDTNPKTSAVGKADYDTLQSSMTDLNKLLQDRTSLLETYQELAATGVNTDIEAEEKRRREYEDTAPAIQKQIDLIQGLIDTLRGKQGADLPLLDAMAAKLKLIAAQNQYVDENVQKLGAEINNAIANEATTAFNSAAEAVGNAIAGTETWGEALSDLGRASADFFAGLLKDIAEAIIKMEILSALGITSGGAQGGGFGGAIASLLLGGGSPASASGSDSVAIAAFNSLVAHGGTQGGRMTRSNQSVFDWAGAPRYHTGTSGVGLSANEERAILDRSEAVLTEADPYHPKNRGKLAKGGMAPTTSIKQVLLLDPKEVVGAMSSPPGTETILSVIKSNAMTVKRIIGGK